MAAEGYDRGEKAQDSAGDHSRRTLRRRALALVRLAVSAALVVWLAQSIGWRDVLEVIMGASLPIVMIGCCVYYLGIVLSCWKWDVLLRLEKVEVPMPRLVGWYLIGAFAGSFLPSDIGGDLGRGVYAARFTGRTAAVARSIIVERLTGLAVLMGLALIGLVVVVQRPLAAFAILAMGVAAIAIGLVAAPRLRGALPERLHVALAGLGEMWSTSRRRPDAVVTVWVISLAFQLLACFGPWLNLRAVGVDLPILPVVLVAAMAGVLGALPLSINGWGVREALFVTFLTPLGAPADAVLGGVLLGRALVLLLSLVGALPWMLEQK
jgi:glycosyltransferase 2 family protein